MNVNYPELRSTAEVILNSSSSSHLWRYQPLQPTFPPRPQIYWEDVTTGIPYNNRMSIVRRFFCLLVTFDLLLTLLIWFICMVIVSGSGDIVHILTDQVLHYHIQRSFFDVVMSAFSRFLFLLLIYGCLRVSHWWAVALSTSLTCMFLIAKVFVFDWAAASQPILQVMLILVSFILSWSEAWFVDFRVLPQEMQAREFLQASNLYNSNSQNSIIRGLEGVNATMSVDNPESIANYFSPKGSPAGSDIDVDTSYVRPVDSAYNEDNEYRKRARDILTSALSILNAPNWREEQRTSDGDLIEKLKLSKSNTIFRLSGRFHYPPSFLLEELFTRVDHMPSWNKTVTESKRLKIIDDNFDITYQVSPGGGGGLVASRDFIMLRHWDVVDGAYILASSSITLPTMPKAEHVRGENGPGCFVIRPVDGEEGWCDFVWLLNTDLRTTWVPKAALDSGFVSALIQYARHLREYSEDLHKTGVLK